MLRKSTVAAIVVTHHPDDAFPQRIEPLIPQVASVLIVDNHSNGSARSMLKEMSLRPNVGVIWNSENAGLAAALNKGMDRAMKAGYEWALLFDQDSTPAEDIIGGLNEAYQEFEEKDSLAVLGSNYEDRQTGRLAYEANRKDVRGWVERKVVITSGSLVSLQAYKKTGPFRSEYFIDCVDLEYCLRARKRGFRIIMTVKPLMVHSIGRPKEHSLLWKKFSYSSRSPLRGYYLVRNHIVLAKDYLGKEPGWVFGSLWEVLKSIMLGYVFGEIKLGGTRYLAIGFWDGMLSNFNRKLVSDSTGEL